MRHRLETFRRMSVSTSTERVPLVLDCVFEGLHTKARVPSEMLIVYIVPAMPKAPKTTVTEYMR